MLSVSFHKAFFISSIIYFHFLSVNCVVPTLSVKKVNSKLIERKRQDTSEICRLFNEENSRRQISSATNIKSNVNNSPTTRHRIKRNVDSNKIDNPVLHRKDILRVEKIVDKLYDDFEDNGNHITYRQRNLENVTKGMKDKQNRRFNFAPAQLFGPLEKNTTLELTAEHTTLEEITIPWTKKWKHGILPYFIDPNTYDSLLSDIILKAFDYIEKVSCIRLQRLREKPVDKQSLQSVEWLYITNPSGIRQCVHSNERKPNTGVQMVVLGYDCLSQGEIAHEVMHVLGFSHEHTRSDRDRYITILWDNIKPGYKKYFATRHDGRLLNLPYDYASVLHYPPRAFSKNGQITIMTESEIKVGQREALSELDVEKIGMIYGHECVERNKDYLLKTCPSVVKIKPKTKEATAKDIEEYFKDRIWPYGIVNYQLKDKMEFTAEERENMKAVFDHIEKETCIEFRDIADKDDLGDNDNSTETTIALFNKEKNTAVQSTKENEESATVTSDKETDKQIEGNDTNVENEIITNESNPSERVKMTIKLSELNRATSPSNMKLFEKHDTSDESNRRYVKQTATSNKTVLPKSPARRHAANVLVLSRSTKPGCQCPAAGRPNGNQVLTINADCFNSVNDLLHLFVHVLGLEHQHKMYDRDSFLHIEWEKLTPEITEDIKNTLPPAASAGFAYDYQSVMHYPWLRIKDGVTNIMYPIWNDGWAMGNWQGLSWVDVQKINLIYTDQCEKRKQHTRNI
ncbi:uncharacterized protein LOC123871060 isoform X2 [Maniola jurtina]|uniref:uncharacterized protein LOC123871060 isoform X2 n=1 Tax=Maniola jurtina TaxID=191418 RepID=UPI001E68A77B|nr:uncharacterized protein LOC123871060 isoform X2 [Maniola jurtina]